MTGRIVSLNAYARALVEGVVHRDERCDWELDGTYPIE